MPLGDILPRRAGSTQQVPSPLVVYSGTAGKVVSLHPDLSFDPFKVTGKAQGKRWDGFHGETIRSTRTAYITSQLINGGNQDAYSLRVGSDPPSGPISSGLSYGGVSGPIGGGENGLSQGEQVRVRAPDYNSKGKPKPTPGGGGGGRSGREGEAQLQINEQERQRERLRR